MSITYFDHAATTPVDQNVLDAMMPYFSEEYGNPSSVHQLGRSARNAAETARLKIAETLNAAPGEIIFTSGGTEADNLALKSVQAVGCEYLVTSDAEHDAVLNTARELSEQGRSVQILPVGNGGLIRPAQVNKCLAQLDGRALVSLMYVNNEIGTVTDLQAIAEVCQAHKATLHTDAVQAVGLFPLDVKELGVDMLSVSAHKFYGPKGIGVLYVRGGLDVSPQVIGGGQERERRSGTENVPLIVGMQTALQCADADRFEIFDRLHELRSRFLAMLDESIEVPFHINQAEQDRWQSPHIVNLVFPSDEVEIDGEMLLLNMDMEGVAVSSGSACASGAVSPSHVLRAIGHDKATASAALRFSMGKSTTKDDIEHAVFALQRVLDRMTKTVAT